MEFKVSPDSEDKIIELVNLNTNSQEWENYYGGENQKFVIAQTIDWDEPMVVCKDIQPNRRAKVLEPNQGQYVIGWRDEDSYFTKGFRTHIANITRKFMVTTDIHLFERNFCPNPVNLPHGWHVANERDRGWV